MSLATTYRTVALAAICVGCNTEPCTLIGCVGGLHIILPSDVDVNQAVHVEIELPDGSQQEQLCEVSSDARSSSSRECPRAPSCCELRLEATLRRSSNESSLTMNFARMARTASRSVAVHGCTSNEPLCDGHPAA